MKRYRPLSGIMSARSEEAASAAGDGEVPGAPLGGTKAEATQRLQVGLAGIGSMVLLVGLASVLGKQADLTDESAVPEAAPTTEPTPANPQRDPLADAGIVPDIPAEPDPARTTEPQGAAPPAGGQGAEGNGNPPAQP